MQTSRRIIHIDMDCFYAAVEMREHPELAGRPIAVGGASGRGVLTTCNYPAREYGVRSAMPVFKAKQLCPQLVILPVRFELYREASRNIREIFKRYTELVEPLSLDEAYLDVSHHKRRGAELAEEIRAAIYAETGLTASAGIGPNKLVAKIASDWNKPNGQCVVSPSRVAAFMQDLPVRRIWGVGPKSAARLSEIGVETCGQLHAYEKAELASEFGSFGLELHQLCRGIDERPVEANRIRKSLSNEHTFAKNIETLEDCEAALRRQQPRTARRPRQQRRRPPNCQNYGQTEIQRLPSHHCRDRQPPTRARHLSKTLARGMGPQRRARTLTRHRRALCRDAKRPRTTRAGIVAHRNVACEFTRATG